MQEDRFFVKKLRKKFLESKVTDFHLSLDPNILDIEDKTRSNCLPWRGQFYPQLIENLLLAYCPRNGTVFDPFAGSGTVLYESACLGIEALGCEINPAAWALTRLYEMTNLSLKNRQELIQLLTDKLNQHLPNLTFFNGSPDVNTHELMERLSILYKNSEYFETIMLDGLIILLDLKNKPLTLDHIHNTFFNQCLRRSFL